MQRFVYRDVFDALLVIGKGRGKEEKGEREGRRRRGREGKES